jgi:FKBP-type peptidyl-prolyl cis-trans isomerase
MFGTTEGRFDMTGQRALVGLMLSVLAAASCARGGKLTSTTEKASYAIGLDVGASLQRFQDELDLPLLIQGLTDQLNDREKLLTPEEANAVLQEFATLMQQQSIEERDGLMEKNMAEGQAFLAENSTKSGVVTTESGLQYLMLTEGDGATPVATDQVTVHYRGTLLDDTVFDSSYDRGEPVTFPVNGVIPGWTEALQLMKVGGKYRLFIPADLAYGEQGAGADIGPNATLIFEVELLAIQ